jgi:hypothetical protein
MPTCTPPSTPLISAGQSESVSATNAPGSASHALRCTRVSAKSVVTPGAR